MGRDLSKSFLNTDFTDIKVKCGKKTFDCHRVILSARSRYFKTMLLWEGSETNKKMIEIKDFDSAVISHMLQYIYTGKLDDTVVDEEMVSDILKAANKYELDALKALCEDKLSDVLEKQNCLRIFILSDFHQASVLKKEALEVITSNREDVFQTEEWERCVREHPDLAIQITKAPVNVGN